MRRAKDLSDRDILHGTSQQFSVDSKYHKERRSKYASFRTFSVGIAQAIVFKVITPCRIYNSFISSRTAPEKFTQHASIAIPLSNSGSDGILSSSWRLGLGLFGPGCLCGDGHLVLLG
jgi:hypothetical protein